MRIVAFLAACTLLSACGLARGGVGDHALTDYDLTDSTVTVDLIAALDETDRPAFRQFLVHHLATSGSFCGEALFDERGKSPSTIGEAIRLTRLREERLALQGKPFDMASLTPRARRAIDLELLNRERGFLNDLIANAQMTGESATVAENQRKIAELTARIQRLQAAPI
ncbi:hypothetical protein J4558_00430 [Leptolyngbya sp. 15MV]|nr:hypothetical protein J4558_00430 [Leptolyngbya sp. 15MV]